MARQWPRVVFLSLLPKRAVSMCHHHHSGQTHDNLRHSVDIPGPYGGAETCNKTRLARMWLTEVRGSEHSLAADLPLHRPPAFLSLCFLLDALYNSQFKYTLFTCVARGSARISLHGVRTRLGERRTPLAEYTATRRAG